VGKPGSVFHQENKKAVLSKELISELQWYFHIWKWFGREMGT